MTNLNLLTILLLTALFVALSFRKIRLPALLGYIVVGIVIGPHILGWLKNKQIIHDIAEFGIVFLMFTIGLEFSFSKLRSLKKVLLGLGGLQVLLTTIPTVGIAVGLGVDMPASIIIGGVVAMSSTAIVLKILTEQTELYSPHGQNAVGILLLQDIAVVPFLILISKLTSDTDTSMVFALVSALGKSILLIMILMIVSRFLIQRLLKLSAATSSPELFTLVALTIVTSFSWLSSFFGLSLSLGAFLAGMMLSQSEYRHQTMIEIRPFRDILLGLFFITLGMQLDLQTIPEIWPWVGLLLTALILFKIALITILGLIFNNTLNTALRTGLILAQGGEFGLVLLIEGLKANLLPPDYGQVILTAILISMIISPFILNFNSRIAKLLLPSQPSKEIETVTQAKQLTKDIAGHAIIFGFGRVGQQVVHLLDKESLPYIAIDADALKVNQAAHAGKQIIYGDACQIEMLRAIKIEQSRCVVICISNNETNLKLLKQIQFIHPQAMVLIRSQSDMDIKAFEDLGANEVIPEILESSLILGSHCLIHMGISATKVYQDVELARHQRYQLYSQIFPNYLSQNAEQKIQCDRHVHHFTITNRSALLGTCLKDLDCPELCFIALHRCGINLSTDRLLEIPLQENDKVVVFGPLAQIKDFIKH